MRAYDEDFALKVKKYIEDYCEQNGCGPAVRDISAALNVHSSRAGRYMILLYERGEITRNTRGVYESLSLSNNSNETKNIAILGSVPCGPLTEVDEYIEGYARLPKSLIGEGKFFFLTASGESMIEAGINDGDLVLIRQQETAEVGQIVVALVDNEVTLKRLGYNEKKKRFYLHPENKSMKDIDVENLSIQGIAVRVLKDLI